MKVQTRDGGTESNGPSTPAAGVYPASFGAGRCGQLRRRARFHAIASMAVVAVVGGLGVSTARAANNTLATVNSSPSLDLGAMGSYTPAALPGTKTDLEFSSSGTYSGTYILSAASVTTGSLDDMYSGTITIGGGTPADTITLNQGTNAVAPNTADDLYVAAGATLNLGTNGLVIATTGNFDIVGTATISSVISGTGSKGLAMTGAGTLTLAAADTYGSTSGVTAVNSGTLNIGGGTGSGSITSALALGGGTLTYTRTGTHTLSPLSTTFNVGTSAVNTNITTDTIALAALTRSAGAAVDFTTTTGTITTTSTTFVANTILVSAATNGIAFATANGGTTWATNASGTIGGFAAYSTGNANYTSTKNVDVTNGDAPAASFTVNTLRFNAATDALTNSGASIISSGGILVTPTATNASISGGTSIAPGAGDELVVAGNGNLSISTAIVNGSGGASALTKSGTGTLTLSGADTYSGTTSLNAGTLQIGGTQTLAGIISGPGALVMNNGGGILTLQGANTYTGTTAITAGTITLGPTAGTTETLYAAPGGGGFIGNLVVQTAARVNFDSGTFSGGGQIQVQTTGTRLTNSNVAAGPGTVGNNIVLNSQGTAVTPGSFTATTYTPSTFQTSIGGTTTPASTSPITFGGVISGSSDVVIANATTGGGGGPVVLGSATTPGGSNGYETYTGNTIFSGNGTVTMANTNVLPAGSNVIDGTSGSGTPTLVLNGFNQQVGYLADGTIAPGTKILTITNNGTANATLTVGNATTPGTAAFSGTIIDGTGPGTLAITKVGADTITLSGTSNTFSGGVAVNAGQLAITGLLTGTGTVNVGGAGSAATLSGNGAIFGPVAVNNQGALTPGVAGAGNLTVTGLTLGTTSSDTESLNVTSSAAITDSGALTINSTNAGTITINLSGSVGSTGLIPVITYAGGAPNTAGITIGSVPSSVTGYSLYTAAGTIDINITQLANPTWRGNLSSSWDTSTQNWVLGTSTTTAAFANTDTVLFDDTASNFTVTIGTAVSPGGVNFNNSSNNYTLTGAAGITGGASVIKNGSGAVTISNSNTYSGGTTLNAGTLVLNNGASGATTSSAIGTGVLTITGGALDSTVAGITLGTNNLQNWNGSFGFTGTNSLNLGSGAVTLGASLTVTVSANTLTVGGTIGDGSPSNGYSLNKAGAGTLVFSSASTFTGTTSVSGGTLVLGQASGTQTLYAPAFAGAYAGNLVVANGIRVNFDSGNFSGGGNIQVQSTGTALTNSNTAPQPGSGSGPGTVSNSIQLNSTGIAFTKGDVTQGTYAPGSFVTTIGGTTTPNSTSPITFSGVISGNSDVNIANSASAGGGGGTVALGHAGTPGGANGYETYTGTTTINNNGIITLASSNVLPTNTDVIVGTQTGIGKATLNVNGFNQQIGSISDGVNVTASAHTVTIINNGVSSPATLTIGDSTTPASSFSGPIDDGTSTLAVTKTGTDSITLSGGNRTYSGGTIVNGGTLLVTGAPTAVSNTITLSSTGLGGVAVNGGRLGGTGTVGNGTNVLNTSLAGPFGAGGVVAINAGAIISPGKTTLTDFSSTGVGTLATGDMTWNGGTPAANSGAYYFKTNVATASNSTQISSLTAGTQDLVVSKGVLNIVTSSGNFILNLVYSDHLSGPFIVANAESIQLNGSSSGLTPTPGNPVVINGFTVQDNGTQDASETTEVIADGSGSGYDIVVLTPEPGSLGLLGVASLGLLRRSRRPVEKDKG